MSGDDYDDIINISTVFFQLDVSPDSPAVSPSTPELLRILKFHL